jgi:hypothetical protein
MMKKQIRFVISGVLLLSFVFILWRFATPTSAMTLFPARPLIVAQAVSSTAETSKEACLKCHGPFEKLATANPNYGAPSGEKITPHMYVPHNSKEDKGIPQCTNCHQPHPVPPTAGGATLAKPDVQWCYGACHHENNFENCKKCHK